MMNSPIYYDPYMAVPLTTVGPTDKNGNQSISLYDAKNGVQRVCITSKEKVDEYLSSSKKALNYGAGTFLSACAALGVYFCKAKLPKNMQILGYAASAALGLGCFIKSFAESSNARKIQKEIINNQ